MKRAGIEMELDMMDWGAHTKVRNTRQFTFYSSGMGARADPHQMYYMDLYSKSRGNNSGYSNPELDHLLEKGGAVLDLKERKKLYSEALRIIQRDVPEIYLNMGPILMGVRPTVKNFSTGGMEERIAFMDGGLAYTWIEH
jgi:peptide/nickel transport system substrate-binding protein